jgi:TonB-linked SusC/RagA family outer membrane protein
MPLPVLRSANENLLQTAKQTIMRRFLTLLVTLVVFSVGSALGQVKQVTGVVTSGDDKQPIPGVNVFVKEAPSVGTTTDINGRYTLKNVPSNGKVLVIRFVGYQALELPIKGGVVDAVLQPENTKIDEVVVVGYTAVKKGTYSGSATTLKANAIENQPIVSPDKALQGNAPGLVTQSTSGQPGSGQKIVVRGIGSITAGTDPLWIIDGVPVATGNYGQMTSTGQVDYSDNSNVLAGINPNDIETMTVLKDASATSIYGSRAANGVIVVTTKRGKTGKTQYNLNVQTGVSSRTNNKLKMLNRDQYMEYQKDAGDYATLQEAIDDFKTIMPLDKNGNLYNFNWMDHAFSDAAPTYNADFSARGGSEKTKFFVSASYMDQTGIVKDASRLKRYSFRSNIENQASDWVKFGLNTTLSLTDQKTPLTTSSYFANPVMASVMLPPVDPGIIDGEPVFKPVSMSANFLSYAKYNDQQSRNYRALSTAFAEVNILKDLRFRTQFGLDFMTINEYQWDDMKVSGNTAVDKGGRASASNVENMILNLTNTLQYNFTLAEKLSSSLLLGQELQSENYRDISGSIEGFPSSDFKQPGSGTNPTEFNGSRLQSRLSSFFSQGNFTWDEKYILTATLRRDGSSRFGDNNRYANFWSVGGAWKMNNEAFIKSIEWINNLQLRASYGTQGNSSIGRYASLGLYSGGYNYNGMPGTAPSQISNPDLTWESQASFNVGLDVTLFAGRLSGTFEFYEKNTNDLLLATPLSSTTGFQSTTKNIGSIQNRGVEFSISATPVNVSGFKWTLDANISKNINKVTKLNKGQDIVQGYKVIREGEDIQSFYLFPWAGVNIADGRPMWYDKDGEIIYTPSGGNFVKALNGSAAPKFVGGFTNTFSYKGLQLSAQLYFQYGNKIFDSQFRMFESFGGRGLYNQNDNALNRWKKPGDVTDYPKPVYGATTYYTATDRYLFDGSFIRLRNLSLSYNLPKGWASKVKMENVRIYAQGTNLLTITKYKGYDPEVGVSGEPWFGYPNVKTVSVGLDLKF